jgi:arylsulfatase A-like enzyme
MRFVAVVFCAMMASLTVASEPRLTHEPFDQQLSDEWHWGLGTWTAKGGVLRGYESGPRRHGPVKMRRCALGDGVVACDFRLEGKATFAGIIFNGSQERGHIVHVVMATDRVRIIAHPQKGEKAVLVDRKIDLPVDQWHPVRIEFKGETVAVAVGGMTITATHPCLAEQKLGFGLGGDSGGPEGEKAGALEFRGLRFGAVHRRPNVLVIIADDQGYSDFGFTGNPLVKTPALDRLAAESAVFKNFVVAAACSPSRSAFYTGRDHLLTGVWGVPPRANLRRDEALMPAFFKAVGHDTLYVGKGDMARLPDSTPWDRGWDDAWTVSGYQHRDPKMPHRHGAEQFTGWTAEIMTDLILNFWRDQPREKPWFVTAAFIIPHLPFQCDDARSRPFRDQGLSPELAECYGSIAQMDACIGRLLGGLRETGQDRDTIVVFTSDNGMSSKGEPKKEFSEHDWATRNVHRLRGHKAWVFENGIRVPLLVRWTGTIEPGDRKQFGCAEDILPTVLDLAGIDPEAVPHLPFTGVSLRPALENAAMIVERPDAFRLAISGAGSPRGAPGEAIERKYEDHHLVLRGPRFKYHALPGGKSLLYDIEADPGETTDVSDQQADVAAALAAECRERWKAVIATGRTFSSEE